MPRDPHGQLVEREFLTMPVWDQFGKSMATDVAKAVERCLPEPWAFARVEHHNFGGQKRQVAFFDWNSNAFALILGGKVTLGYDPANLPKLPAKKLAAWVREWPDFDWKDYLTEIMSPLRTVELQPYLIAVHATTKTAKTGKGERAIIRREGFALPTADQWEHACAAGSRTLWRWGDRLYSRVPELRPSAFGLVISRNTYHVEALDVVGEFRGGDGGVREHGGAGEIEARLPLASWYLGGGSEDQEDWWQYTFYRRVFPLPPAMLD